MQSLPRSIVSITRHRSYIFRNSRGGVLITLFRHWWISLSLLFLSCWLNHYNIQGWIMLNQHHWSTFSRICSKSRWMNVSDRCLGLQSLSWPISTQRHIVNIISLYWRCVQETLSWGVFLLIWREENVTKLYDMETGN